MKTVYKFRCEEKKKNIVYMDHERNELSFELLINDQTYDNSIIDVNMNPLYIICNFYDE